VRYNNYTCHIYNRPDCTDLRSCWPVLHRCCDSCSADNFCQWNYRYLESCYKQCCYHDLHLHSGCWAVRYNNYTYHIYNRPDCTDLRSCWPVLHRCCDSCPADNFYQWNYRYLESCYKQCCYHDLHLHSGCWSVRYNYYTYHIYNRPDCTDLRSCWSVLHRCCDSCSADYFNQWNYWYLESCYKQCCYHDLHLHSGCWSVRCNCYSYHIYN
jgi:hypothetical protein